MTILASTLSALAIPLLGLGVCALALGTLGHDPDPLHFGHGCLAVSLTAGAASSAVAGDLRWAVLLTPSAAWYAWLWWRNRRRRDRAPRSYGQKSRDRLAALIARYRKAARPRPLLRPV